MGSTRQEQQALMHIDHWRELYGFSPRGWNRASPRRPVNVLQWLPVRVQKFLIPLLSVCPLFAQAQNAHRSAAAADPGRKLFENRCSGCHGADGNGGELGPPIARRVAGRNDAQITKVVSEGIAPRGMPATDLTDTEMKDLIRFLRTLRGRGFGMMQPVKGKVQTETGQTLDGLILNQGFADMQLRTEDERIHLLRRIPGSDRVREVTSDIDWPSYDGELRGNRYSRMDQINAGNVGRLVPKWVFSLPNTS